METFPENKNTTKNKRQKKPETSNNKIPKPKLSKEEQNEKIKEKLRKYWRKHGCDCIDKEQDRLETEMGREWRDATPEDVIDYLMWQESQEEFWKKLVSNCNCLDEMYRKEIRKMEAKYG